MKKAYQLFIFNLAFLVCSTNNAHAEKLQFKAGQAASYTISQQVDVIDLFMGEKSHLKSDSKVTMDVRILSVSNTANGYPIDVEVSLKNIHFTVNSPLEKKKIKFNSEKNRDDSPYADSVARLLSQPLYFTIKGPFQIIETSGFLAQLNESSFANNVSSSDESDWLSDDDSDIYLSRSKYSSDEEEEYYLSELAVVGTTPWSFNIILTQLFHLSGENLKAKQSIPAEFYQLFNWEDEELDPTLCDISDSGSYQIEKIDAKNISSNWNGKVKLKDHDTNIEGNISLLGNVKWNKMNPLVQKRDLEFTMNADYSLANIKMNVKQKFEARSL